MKKAKYGYEDKEMHEGFFKALEGEKNPYIEEDDLHSVMEQIQEFLDACYMIGVNPLREMRKMLPQYTWQFHVSCDRNQTRKIVSNSDFIWRVNWMVDMPNEWSGKVELVTATKPDRPRESRPSNFWVAAKFDGEKLKRNIAFVEVHDGSPVYYEQSEE